VVADWPVCRGLPVQSVVPGAFSKPREISGFLLPTLEQVSSWRNLRGFPVTLLGSGSQMEVSFVKAVLASLMLLPLSISTLPYIAAQAAISSFL
jgi:hypothetical protein